ncbi:MAG TPA: hypothetical protein VK095_03985 [Beutenbergiaceae bacterium]|nr:hypothetical protein [Beutenbergiaceae bacterium]
MSTPAAHGLRRSLQDLADEQLTVYGVHMGVDTTNLAGQLGRLDLVAEQARAILTYIRRAADAVEQTSAHAPRTGAGAGWATSRVAVSGGDLPDQVTDLRRSLRTAIEEYQRQEQELANRLYVQAGASLPLVSGPLGGSNQNQPWPSSLPALNALYLPRRLFAAGAATMWESLRNGRWTPSDTQTGYFLRATTSAFLDAVGVDRGDSPVHTFASLIVPVLTRGVSTRVRVRRVAPPRPLLRVGNKVLAQPGKEVLDPGPTTSIEGIVTNVGRLYPNQGAEPGSIRVDRLVGEDGSVSWQVYVPGTQSAYAPWGGDVPNDWAANLQMFNGEDSAASAAVVAAMRAAGVRPGEPVMVAGHSQGGLVAAALAADEQVRDEFTIASMVTIGSPVGHFEVPEDVAALHLEHTDDLVAGLDDQPNPIAPNRTTIERDVTEHMDEAGFGSVVTAHDIPAYIETGALADASTDPEVLEWLAVNAQILDPTANVSSVYLRSERVP